MSGDDDTYDNNDYDDDIVDDVDNNIDDNDNDNDDFIDRLINDIGSDKDDGTTGGRHVGPVSSLIQFIQSKWAPPHPSSSTSASFPVNNNNNDIKQHQQQHQPIDQQSTEHTTDVAAAAAAVSDSLEHQIEHAEKVISDYFHIKPKRLNEILLLLGGASLVSFAFRTMIFGKTIRAIEIPDGNLTTIVLRANRVSSLKKTILQHQPPIYPGVHLDVADIKASAFIDPNFTEPILTNRHVRLIDDGGYVIWTKADFEIPRQSVALKALIKDRELFMRYSQNAEIDRIIKLISLFGPPLSDYKPSGSGSKSTNNSQHTSSSSSSSSPYSWRNIFKTPMPTDQELLEHDPSGPLSQEIRDELISRLLLNDKADDIVQLYRKHQDDILMFKQQLVQYYLVSMKKRQEKAVKSQQQQSK
ncbi:hypothetical protein SAMD00019534_088890 [Acytostelium subglobosum LB1]|uniref:hypothetical protein n=1 Tax=Acytostelium subglobosum LB1 TaxID=1410327 RepID=UPI000644AB16|nr:hypothetical protein SAMD00019534_088890 [Acytostelium subglobosum LB1]GAM25714.1 hypothetical protein SAMD00019534_088890 [Acytostelium subglobosum LB1]|eukprot:XP_012751232.1 hypothetical protein SAMD00019534_088890 [Acytostelium subglobosum LB1]